MEPLQATAVEPATPLETDGQRRLAELQKLLAGSATAQVDKVKLDEQLARANALRDTPMPKGVGTSGYVSPLAHLSRAFDQVRGINQARTANAGLTKARQKIADAAAGRTGYDLAYTAERDLVGDQQKRDARDSKLKASIAAQELARTNLLEQREYDKKVADQLYQRGLKETTPQTLINNQTGEPTVIHTSKDGTRNYTVDGSGNPIEVAPTDFHKEVRFECLVYAESFVNPNVNSPGIRQILAVNILN